MRTSSLLALAFFFFGACSGNNPSTKPPSLPDEIASLENLLVVPPASEETRILEFSKSQVFGELYPPAIPPAPTMGFGPKYAVDNQQNVYFTNPYDLTIHVFNSDGSPKKNIGQSGRGPRDFNSITGIYAVDNKLIAKDGNLQRIQIFDTKSQELTGSFAFDPTNWDLGKEVLSTNVITYKVMNDGILAAVQMQDNNERSNFGYFRLSFDGQVQSPIILEELQQGTHTGENKKFGYTTTLTLPTSDKDLITTYGESIYRLNTSQFLIKQFDKSGNYQRAIYYPIEKDAVEKDEVLAEFHPNSHSVFDDAEFPEFWPAVQNFLIDDEGRFWVGTIGNDHAQNTWFVLKPAGELMGTFTWPTSKPIQLVKFDKLYTAEEDTTLGATQLISYDIQW